ncbi:MAG: NAD(P)-dependent oxidoreductase [Desulfobacula sp.]|jgi:nucleoside-diphosphate-sugar epimerase|nr:NAD(P)-dependent oxidoreductase [Desulfobacula sp.]MBT7261104.1 NAD(P)-dependent oxidoreductase [Desulfobacula sp.]
MKIAVTGGTGFVGKKLVLKHLKNGDSVRVLTRKSGKDIDLPKQVEIHNADLLGRSDPLVSFVNNSDVLYHCAAELNNEKLMNHTHVEGTKNLLEAASGRIGRWVQLSSVGVYGPYRAGIINETTPNNPVGEYEVTKARSDEIIMDAGLKSKIEYSILRPSNIFGPTMKNQSLFQLIKMIDRQLFFFIGRPGASANYIHVDNVIDALIKCGEKKASLNRVFNISDYMVMEDFIGVIADKLNKSKPKFRLPENMARFAAGLSRVFTKVPLTRARVDALTLRSSYSIEKIKSKLGYSHKKTMEQGLAEMVDAFKET